MSKLTDFFGVNGTSSVTFSSTQNWTVPANITLIYVTAQAGGGGGGGSGTPGSTFGTGSSALGSGGANGGNAGMVAMRVPFTVTQGDVIAVTVGAGGAAGATGSAGSESNGGAGGAGSDSLAALGATEIVRCEGGTGGALGRQYNGSQNAVADSNGLYAYQTSMFSAGAAGGANSISATADGGSSAALMGRSAANGGADPENFTNAKWGGAGGGGGHSLRSNGGAGGQGTQAANADGTAGAAGALGSGGGGAGGAYADTTSANRVGALGGVGGTGFVIIEF